LAFLLAESPIDIGHDAAPGDLANISS